MLEPPSIRRASPWRPRQKATPAARWRAGALGLVSVLSAFSLLAATVTGTLRLPPALRGSDAIGAVTTGGIFFAALGLGLLGGRWLYTARTGLRPGSWRRSLEAAGESLAAGDLPPYDPP